MKPQRKHISSWLLATCFIASLLARVAIARADSGDDVLKKNGLSKSGNYYLLDIDANLAAPLREMRKADKELENYARKRRDFENDINNASASSLQWSQEVNALEKKLSQMPDKDVRGQNAIIAQINQRVTNQKEAQEFIKLRSTELSKLSAPSDNIQLTLDLFAKLQAANQKYAQLAADPAVTAALAAVNEKAPIKFRLGPSGAFKSAFTDVSKKVDSLDAAALKLDMSGSVPRVKVTLNGTTTLPMVLDSGASSVSLTSEVANEIGVKPDTSMPQVEVVLADGRHVKVSVGKLATVRLGKFVATDVICTILPPDIKEADCLLGGTFLSNFVYRIDLNAGVLHLSPITGQVKTDATAAGGAGMGSAAGSNAAAPSPISSAVATASAGLPDEEEMLLITATVDGQDDIEIHDNGISWKHLDAAWPTHVRVNFARWNPQTQSHLPSTGNLQFLQSVDWMSAKVVSKSGRGTVGLEPSSDGLLIHFDDPGNGADQYEIGISIMRIDRK